jgi:hypothetical protein
LVVTGSAGLLSGLAMRLRPDDDLALRDGHIAEWRELRAEPEQRRESRRKQRRFLQNPAGYLTSSEKG